MFYVTLHWLQGQLKVESLPTANIKHEEFAVKIITYLRKRSDPYWSSRRKIDTQEINISTDFSFKYILERNLLPANFSDIDYLDFQVSGKHN